jgi:DNA-binding winged helix-turn-helix (wHTH) protein
MRYEFLNFTLNTNTHELSCDGLTQTVEPQVFDLLHLLLTHAGNLVTKEQLVDEIWGGRIVSDSAISACISAARKAVGDDGKRQTIIRTVARRGLQFVAPVRSHETTQAVPRAKPTRGGLKIRYATATDRAKIAYAVHGTGTPLIRLLRFPTHLELDWNEPLERSYIDAYSQNCMLVRFDQRGSGLSEPAFPKIDLEQLANDIGSVADALGLDRFALMGTSGDCHQAVYFAARYPDRVSHLIIQNGYVDGRVLRNGTSALDTEDAVAALMREGWERNTSTFVAAAISLYQPGASKETLRKIAEIFQISCTTEVAQVFREFLNHHSVAPFLDDIRAPTLVMHCRDDSVHPLSEARKMAGGIRNADLVVLESPNHYVMPHEDAWNHHLSELFEFLDRPG